MLRSIYIAVMALVLPAGFLYAQTNVSGNQSGTWTAAGSPYILTSSVTVPAGQTLTIEPGAEVRFPQGNSQLTVQGTLTAAGTATDIIRFTGGGFFCCNGGRGPVIIESSGSNSTIRFVKVKEPGYYGAGHGSNCFIVKSSSVTIENCPFDDNHGTALLVENAAAIVRNNLFTENDYLDITIAPNNLYNVSGSNPLPIINSNAACRSFMLKPGTSLMVVSGYKLDIK